MREEYLFWTFDGELCLLGAALSNLHREGALAWIWVTQDQMQRFGAREEDCEGLVNYALSIADVQVAIFFRASRRAVSDQPAEQKGK